VFSSLKFALTRSSGSAQGAALALPVFSTSSWIERRSSAGGISPSRAWVQVSVRRPSMRDDQVAFGFRPASAARPLVGPSTGRVSGMPTTNISQNAASAKIRLKAGPAATIAARWPSGLAVEGFALLFGWNRALRARQAS
jgi:hypothetical protein